MNHTLSVVYTTTADDLRLQGMHYAPIKKTDTCVLFIHGQSGNYIEQAFADIIGVALASKGISFLYGHNRGYCHINDIIRGQPNPNGSHEAVRYGSAYERFEKCIFDIDAWIEFIENKGYTKIILCGHSLGTTKLIYWWSKSRHQRQSITGVILASADDEVGLVQKHYEPDKFQQLLKEAKQHQNQGQYSHLLSELYLDWFPLSGQTFLSLAVSGSPADVLPLAKNPSTFPHLAKINVPILATYGDHDEINIHSIQEDLDIIKSKATGSPQVTTTIIQGANHNYENRESILADTILNWVKQL